MGKDGANLLYLAIDSESEITFMIHCGDPCVKPPAWPPFEFTCQLVKLHTRKRRDRETMSHMLHRYEKVWQTAGAAPKTPHRKCVFFTRAGFVPAQCWLSL